jgi:hypothetical protein
MSNIQKILIDDHLDHELALHGHVVIPFLTPKEVTSLHNFYFEHHLSTQEGMYATAHVPDIPFRIKMNDFIKETFARRSVSTFMIASPWGVIYR